MAAATPAMKIQPQVVRDRRGMRIRRRSYQCDVQPSDADQGNLRAFPGIHFKCCKTYRRIYRIHHRYVYEGRCPKCRGLLTVPIGPGGTDSRFLTAQ